MKYFGFFLFFAQLLLITGTVLVSVSSFVHVEPGGIAADTGPRDHSGPSGDTVEIYDWGLNQPQGSYVLPDGWSLQQSVATHPVSGTTVGCTIEFTGPQGELIRNLGLKYNQPDIDFPEYLEEWQVEINRVLYYEIDSLVVGDLKPTEPGAAEIHYMKGYIREGQELGYREASISGSRNGNPVRGVVRFVAINPSIHPDSSYIGKYISSITISPAERFDHTLKTEEAIVGSYTPNPAFEPPVYIDIDPFEKDGWEEMLGNESEKYRYSNSNWVDSYARNLLDSIYDSWDARWDGDDTPGDTITAPW